MKKFFFILTLLSVITFLVAPVHHTNAGYIDDLLSTWWPDETPPLYPEDNTVPNNAANTQAGQLAEQTRELGRQRSNHAPGSPEYIRLTNEMNALREQVKDLQGKGGGNEPEDGCDGVLSSLSLGCLLKESWSATWKNINYFAEKMVGGAGNFLIYIAGFLVYLSAAVFEYSLNYTVNNFASLLDSPGITAAWGALRDFANIFFIFILLYVAIGFILDLEIGNKNKLIANVIVIAFLINFSAFFARAIIDVSNIASYQFFQSVNRSGQTYDSALVGGADGKIGGVTGLFMNHLNLQRAFDTPSGTATGVGKTLAQAIGAVSLMLVTAFVFLAAGLLLLIRMIVLIFMVILSPLAFLAYTTPKLSGHFSKWWNLLIKYSFFAPIYLLFVFLSTKVMSQGAIQSIAADSQAAGIAGIGAMLINFIIVIGLMVGSLIAAVQFGIHGAKYASDLGKKWRQRAVGTIGANTVGRLGRRIATSDWAKNQIANRTIIGGSLTKFASTISKEKFGGEKSFDKKIDELAKIPDEIKDDPELVAKYLAALGRKRNIFGGKIAQQRAYEKMKVEDKLKLESGLKKSYEEKAKDVKSKEKIEQEKEDFISKNREDLNWYDVTYPSMSSVAQALPENIAKVQKVRGIKRQIRNFDKQIEKAPGTPEEIQARQQKAGKKYQKLSKVVEGIQEEMPEPMKKKLREARETQEKKDKRKNEIKTWTKQKEDAERAGNQLEADRLEALILAAEQLDKTESLEAKIDEQGKKKEGEDKGGEKEKKKPEGE